MPNLTIAIPAELKKEIDELPEMNWSEILRGMLTERVKRLILLKKLDKMLENSELTEEDTIKLGRTVKKSMHERLKKKHPEWY